MMLDPIMRSRVATRMTRSIGATLLAVALAAGAGACGGSTKPATTPSKLAPAKDGTDPSAMQDTAAPAGGGTAPTGGAMPAGGSPGSDMAGSANAAADEPAPPPITMPNLDPDPAQAKSQVEDHLRVARAALAANPPDPDGALREAKAALAIDGANVDAAAMVAFADYHKHLYDTAEVILDDVFKRDAAKQNANVYYVYGLIYDKTNRPEQAVAAYRKAVELDPNHVSAQINLGVHLLENKSYAEAQALFEKLGRTDAVSLTSLASAYRGHSADYAPGSPDRDQLIQRAQQAYERALAADRNYGPAYYDLGLLYLDADPFPSAGGQLDTLQRLNQAQSYFDNYKNMPGVDMKLYDERMKDIAKAIKREQKKRGKAKKAP
jgi:tetratricopeptide (TPR) repeat protein